MQCQEEYIALVAQFEEKMRTLLKEVEDGDREEFEYER